jgi:polysaccharide export outer membrane protein
VKLKEPKVSVGLAQTRSAQRISGPHLIRPDGSIGLGSYGSVPVAGMTLSQVKRTIEDHLANYLQDPEVSIEVQGFNSKTVYVILDGGGAGQTVQRLPCTGNETVLDAIAQVNGLSQVSSTDRIWVARPAPAGMSHQILPVNWNAVVRAADTTTNYQLFPGDRVYVAAQPMVRVDTRLSRVLAPVERLLGVVLLGSGTVNSISGRGTGGGFGGFGGF